MYCEQSHGELASRVTVFDSPRRTLCAPDAQNRAVSMLTLVGPSLVRQGQWILNLSMPLTQHLVDIRGKMPNLR
jgi:hypothetical protein